MSAEALHHATFALLLSATTTIYQPVNLYYGCPFHAMQEVGNRTVLNRDDELIQVYYSYPSGIKTMTLYAVVISGQLTLAAREIIIFDYAGFYVGC